jgi:DNA-binding NarL/FixJ family response regulator
MLAIQQVLAGQIYVSDKMSSRILELFSGRKTKTERSALESLSDREFEIFQLIGNGRSSREIAQQLHLSIKTVEVHRQNMRIKLGLGSGAELVRYAIRWLEAQGAG